VPQENALLQVPMTISGN